MINLIGKTKEKRRKKAVRIVVLREKQFKEAAVNLIYRNIHYMMFLNMGVMQQLFIYSNKNGSLLCVKYHGVNNLKIVKIHKVYL